MSSVRLSPVGGNLLAGSTESTHVPDHVAGDCFSLLCFVLLNVKNIFVSDNCIFLT